MSSLHWRRSAFERLPLLQMTEVTCSSRRLMGPFIGLSHVHKAAELVFSTTRFLLPSQLCCELHNSQRFQQRSILHIWKVRPLPLICCVILAGSLLLPLPAFTCLQNRSENGYCLLESVVHAIGVECHMQSSLGEPLALGGTVCLKTCFLCFFEDIILCHLSV